MGTNNVQNYSLLRLTCHSEATLLLTRGSSNREVLNWRLVSIPPPMQCLSPWATLKYERVHTISRSLVPEPSLYVELSPAISSIKSLNCLKTMFLRDRLEGICIFLLLQSRISLKHSRNLEEFQCVKDKGASLSWTPVISDPSDGAASRTVIHQ